MMRLVVATLVAVVIGIAFFAPVHLATGTQYLPKSGDGFSYQETITLSNGVGNYTGYTENSFYNGSIRVTSILPNATDSAVYQSSGTYRNNAGQSYPWSESGSFSFSARTFHYVQGTDNQTGYVNPYVWFYINSTAGQGSAVWLLNTQMNVVSIDSPFALGLSSTGYAASVLAEGNGSYQRHDVYGVFTAAYQWKANYDPSTGFVLGYVYSETDSDGAGDGFTMTDILTDSQTSFTVTPTAAPPSTGGGNALATYVGLGVVILILVVIVVVAVLVLRRRSSRATSLGGTLPRHPVGPVPPPPAVPWTPPPLDLIPHDQPTPQVVLRETVRVPCRFCGTLIDSTATVCPKCGAPRT
ncbi:MAG TPA: zinc ribbon domain-containing protein [Thermoplasmata archaeon]|nr:zinc ribbon domain-containing protein [Thermoplasmata archaeon]